MTQIGDFRMAEKCVTVLGSPDDDEDDAPNQGILTTVQHGRRVWRLVPTAKIDEIQKNKAEVWEYLEFRII
jgi:hypothetical protein